MIVNCFQINEKLQLAPFPLEKAVDAHENTDTQIWIDLIEPTPIELEEWLDRLGVTGLSRRLCCESRNRPGLYPLKNELFMVLPVLVKNHESHENDYLTFLCRKNQLLSIHHKVILNSDQKSVLELSENWLPARSISGLMSSILINISLTFMNQTTQLRNAILALEDQMDRSPDNVSAEEIRDMRSNLIALGTVVSDQLPSLQSISKIRKPFFNVDDAEEYITCALVNMQAVDSSLDWLDGRISGLRAGYDMHAQDQTNRRLNVLTILTAVFNPATLMVGFWGMNFSNIPLLENPYGYAVAVSLMILTGLFMFLFFRRGGWFG